MKNHKTLIAACFAAVILAGSCVNLDMFVSPVVFSPVKFGPGTNYMLGASTNYSELAEANTNWPDSTLSNRYQEVSYLSGTNRIYAYFLWHSATNSGTILFFRGNMDNIDRYWPRTKILYQTGYNVMVMDYRGYGKSDGTITEAGLMEDAVQSMNYLVSNLGVSMTNILIYGYSVGSVPAVHVAADYPGAGSVRGLVLEAPVGSTEVYVQDATCLPLPDHYMTAFKLDNITPIRRVTVPLLWIHGKKDPMNKCDTEGLAVYNNYGGSVKYSNIVENGTHSDCPRVMDPTLNKYIQGIKTFMEGGVPFAN